MTSNSISPSVAFTKVLRAFQTGGITVDELLGTITAHMAAGAAPDEMLAVLQRREYVEPLPADLHDAVITLITGAAQEPLPPPVAVGAADVAAVGTVAHSAAAAVNVGDTLSNRFHLIELLGTGRASRVFKAVDARRNPDTRDPYVAVKIFDDLPDPGPDSWGLLKHEVLKLQALTQGNIVRTFGCYADGPTTFLIMEYVEGISLATRSMERSAGSALIQAVGNALEYAHSRAVAHGNFSRQKVLISGTGDFKIIGFSIHRARFKEAGGTTGDVPAEPLRQFADDSRALALFSYEILVGHPPFEEELSAELDHAPQLPAAGLSAAEYTAIAKTLQPERQGEVPSVREFVLALFSPQPEAPRRWGGVVAVVGLLIIGAVAILLRQLAPPTAQPPSKSMEVRPSALSPTSAPDAATLPPLPVRDCQTCPLLTLVPAGNFNQGALSTDVGAPAAELPRHAVIIAKPFAMTTNTVTVAEFRGFATSTHRDMRGCDVYDGRWRHQPAASFDAPGFAQTGSSPVTCTSWKDAAAYAKWLSVKTGTTYRLPSAEEWEYAARAGKDSAVPWTSASDACANANVADQSASQRYPGWDVFPCNDDYVSTAPVGSFKANAFGLNDMLGNVFVWMQECWHETYEGAPNDGAVNPGGNCAEHELRGGSWFSTPPYVRASYRDHFGADYRTSTVGIRLIREVGP